MTSRQAHTTRTVKRVLADYADQVASVHTRWIGSPTCDQQTTISLNAAGWENADTIYVFATGAFPEARVTLYSTGFLSIAWPPGPLSPDS